MASERPPRRTARTLALGGALTLAVALGLSLLLTGRAASSDRDWAADHALAPRVTFSADTVRISGVRDFRHRPSGGYTPSYRDESYPLAGVRGVWFGLAPFARRWRGLGHTFLSFEMEDGRFLAVSVEARREEGEDYSLARGLLRGFEITYVLATEEDVVGLRAVRGDTLFLYPSRATPEQARALLADVLRRSEKVRTSPEFYHTLLNNCATNLRDHVNRVASDPLPVGWGLIFPGYSDALALDHGLLDTDLPLEEARERFRVDERARAALATGGDFSRAIRERR
jgi:hypothetical protein